MDDGKVRWYLATMVQTRLRPAAVPLVSDALERIGRTALLLYAQPLQLLAMRRYLRAQNRDHRDLASRWSWTAKQVSDSFNALPCEDGSLGLPRQLMAEAARVQKAFASANPGYTLGISPPRDLDRQVKLWNDSADGRLVALDLFRRALKELSADRYDLPAEASRVAEFALWLQDSKVTPELGNAAPGTSDHGQMRAIDFVVMAGGRIVASTTRATIATEWVASGWAAKLAMATMGSRLCGPLRHPYEPWHWAIL